jgi:hypothetical protein
LVVVVVHQVMKSHTLVVQVVVLFHKVLHELVAL